MALKSKSSEERPVFKKSLKKVVALRFLRVEEIIMYRLHRRGSPPLYIISCVDREGTKFAITKGSDLDMPDTISIGSYIYGQFMHIGEVTIEGEKFIHERMVILRQVIKKPYGDVYAPGTR